MELRDVFDRIHKPLEKLIPDEWEKARLVFCEAAPDLDEFIEITEPLHDPISVDIIDPLPPDVLKAMEDLYLLYYAYQRHWTECVINFARNRSRSWQPVVGFTFEKRR